MIAMCSRSIFGLNYSGLQIATASGADIRSQIKLPEQRCPDNVADEADAVNPILLR
jgi:hypothetical protein